MYIYLLTIAGGSNSCLLRNCALLPRLLVIHGAARATRVLKFSQKNLERTRFPSTNVIDKVPESNAKMYVKLIKWRDEMA